MATIWFNKNLRIQDNDSLYEFLKKESSTDGVFIWPNKNAVFEKYSRPQIAALLRYLPTFAEKLSQLGIDLKVLHAKDKESEAQVLLKHLSNKKSKSLYFTKSYERDSEDQIKKIENQCKKDNISYFPYDDQFVIDPFEINNQSNEPFKVFTPFFKSSINFITSNSLPELTKTPRATATKIKSSFKTTNSIFGVSSELHEKLYPISEEIAHKKLNLFCEGEINNYSKTRDYPFLDNTSHLSHFLSLGILTGRQCLHKAIEKNKGHLKGGTKGIDVWISEIYWREFYRYIGIRFPHINKGKPFNEKTSKIPWKKSKTVLDAWSQGKTGIPFVDAGMNQLNSTGWLHNRLRMIVAMFLTKNCLIDWRLGEKYFFENLIDADFFSNNGGWQWSASTGTDAAPYFRIMNPVMQSEKFDSEGAYLKKYIPELNKLGSREIHNPYEYYDTVENYPKPIVPLKESRAQAIETFKKHL